MSCRNEGPKNTAEQSSPIPEVRGPFAAIGTKVASETLLMPFSNCRAALINRFA